MDTVGDFQVTHNTDAAGQCTVPADSCAAGYTNTSRDGRLRADKHIVGDLHLVPLVSFFPVVHAPFHYESTSGCKPSFRASLREVALEGFDVVVVYGARGPMGFASPEQSDVLGGGGLVALSFVAVGLLFPKRLIARAMAAVSTLWGISAFLGPLLGGLFVEFATWRGGFWFFALQALALAAWLGFRVKLRERPSQAGDGQRLPVLRLLFLTAGVVLIAAGGIEIAPLRTTVLVLAGIACLLVFLALDGRRAASRLLPPQPLSLRRRPAPR